MDRRLTIGLCLLLLNSTYLYSFQSPTLWYVSNLFLHLGLGIVLLAGFLLFLKQRFADLSLVGRAMALLFLLAGGSGGLLIYTGAPRPYQWLLNTHILLSCAAAAVLVVYLAGQSRQWRVVALVLLLALVFPAGIWGWRALYPDVNNHIVNPVLAPLTMDDEGSGPDSPFFPSAASTDVGHTIPSEFFMRA